MTDAQRGRNTLNFLWWNAQDLFHFDRRRIGRKRWPPSVEAYDAKRGRIAEVLKECEADLGVLDIIALAEVTEEAATALRDQAMPGYGVHYFDFDGVDSASATEVMFLVRPGLTVEARPPITPQYTPDGNRAMGAIDVVLSQDRIRVVACHWAAPFGDLQERTRVFEAIALAEHNYTFFKGEDPELRKPHLLVVGDFNEEPHVGTLKKFAWASRSRAGARNPHHHADDDVHRIHLYNAGWRLFGEHRPFEGRSEIEVAGTMYWQGNWYTLDQVLVSGSLLTPEPPYLDEGNLRVFASQTCLVDGLPRKFSFVDGVGASDHLPLVGEIVLARS